MLDDRRTAVLQALVEEYIATGQPVSSNAVLRRSGMAVSSATIRNDLARLESYGFVEQPYTSAGRVPTPQGYRFYVDHASPGRLRAATRSRIESFFNDVHHELSRLLKETTGLLSDLSHYPAVVIGPGFAGESVRAFHLVPLAGDVVLAVMVSASGRVSQNVVSMPLTPTDAQLEEAETLLAQALDNQPISAAIDRIEALPADLIAQEVLSVTRAVGKALCSVDASTREVYVGGTAQLAELWQDLAHVHTILGLLDRDESLRRLLDDESAVTTVRLSGEMDVHDVDLAVVSGPYDAGEHGRGRVGVLGPMRMDYRRTIRIVEEVGDNLGDSLGR
ncbi:MAG TPA: heat-inducible transcriptional repressor HrcA [Acidimicrobiia bacterium]|jgi:heat-inducible transcriptional repressor|nr:heat-inducible transcriptional repressor HrcA [Acidimicrobiia bacterium]